MFAESDVHVKTLRVRVKDRHAHLLRSMAREVNTVWNYANDLSRKHWSRTRKFMGYVDFCRYTSGSTEEFNHIGAATIQEVCSTYVVKRRAAKKVRLRWRASGGPKRSLGWVPFKTKNALWRNGRVFFAGYYFKVWDSYGLKKYKFRSGSFSEDARGRWYFNVCVEYASTKSNGLGEIGIDLGLKSFAALSTGETVAAQPQYRKEEAALGVAQRARKRHRVRAIHAKVANRRKDRLHKLSSNLVQQNKLIVVGNVSSSRLAKTNMAKSVLDAGWSMFRTMLEYKAIAHRVTFVEADESFSTQTCSSCSARSGPRGLEGLAIREWNCCACGTRHDRDTNAAKNILAAGRRRLAEGIPSL
jgi:IS605 OrfB family transposase